MAIQDEQTDPDGTQSVDESEVRALTAGCGGRERASLITLAGWEIGREIELESAELVLGRSLSLPVPIGSSSVSRQHAKIVCEDENGGRAFKIVDLESLNGTKVNTAIVKSARLQNGDKIQLGDVLFKFVLQDPLDTRFHQEVHRRIHYDQLTGLLTLDTFLEYLRMAIERAEHDTSAGPGAEGPFTLAMTDLDGLKRVNDTYGHLQGRRVVREMGAMIRQALRSKDWAGLYGGDEAILLFNGADVQEAMEVAERLRGLIRERLFECDRGTFGVTISQGLAEWPTHGTSAEQLIAAADGALYAAKAAGR
ncbi:MAG: GGDEF domain-containing protein, partial [Candidatus Hydrogenedentes bacterium]|nr:GGDEF domain-containing protein [Candidatus Hydrogenedentota bacterium]